VVSIHAPYGVLDFDGPHDPPLRLGRLRMDKLGVFPGSLGITAGCTGACRWSPSSWSTPCACRPNAEVRQMWIDLLRWMSERVSQGLGEHPR
jgi:protein MpaA